jgi:hypothetical protein
MSQQCNTCHIDLPESEFYMQDGFRLFKRCKQCIAASKPKKPRTNGYAQLAQETQASLKAALADRRQKLPKSPRHMALNMQIWPIGSDLAR